MGMKPGEVAKRLPPNHFIYVCSKVDELSKQSGTHFDILSINDVNGKKKVLVETEKKRSFTVEV